MTLTRPIQQTAVYKPVAQNPYMAVTNRLVVLTPTLMTGLMEHYHQSCIPTHISSYAIACRNLHFTEVFQRIIRNQQK